MLINFTFLTVIVIPYTFSKTKAKVVQKVRLQACLVKQFNQ
jgi:hypothetical protein